MNSGCSTSAMLIASGSVRGPLPSMCPSAFAAALTARVMTPGSGGEAENLIWTGRACGGLPLPVASQLKSLCATSEIRRNASTGTFTDPAIHLFSCSTETEAAAAASDFFPINSTHLASLAPKFFRKTIVSRLKVSAKCHPTTTLILICSIKVVIPFIWPRLAARPVAQS